MYHTYKQQIWYLLFGVLTTCINVILYYFAIEILRLSNMQGSILAWIGAVIFAYITNSIWVFKSNAITIREKVKEYSEFLISRLVTGGIDMCIMWVGVDILEMEGVIVKVLANIIVIILNYILSKTLIFK